jgi:DNA-directed RNA polymerase specialized sigma24 family protein
VRRLGIALGDELAAEVFARAFDLRGRYGESRGEVRAWLVGIAANFTPQHWPRFDGRLAPVKTCTQLPKPLPPQARLLPLAQVDRPPRYSGRDTFAVARDITDRKAAEEAIPEYRETLDREAGKVARVWREATR